jgi:hypothetical protein
VIRCEHPGCTKPGIRTVLGHRHCLWHPQHEPPDQDSEGNVRDPQATERAWARAATRSGTVTALRTSLAGLR